MIHHQVLSDRQLQYGNSLLRRELSPFVVVRPLAFLVFLPLLELQLVRPSDQRGLLLQPKASRDMSQVELLDHKNLLEVASVGGVGAEPGTEGIPGKLICCGLDSTLWRSPTA